MKGKLSFISFQPSNMETAKRSASLQQQSVSPCQKKAHVTDKYLFTTDASLPPCMIPYEDEDRDSSSLQWVALDSQVATDLNRDLSGEHITTKFVIGGVTLDQLHEYYRFKQRKSSYTESDIMSLLLIQNLIDNKSYAECFLFFLDVNLGSFLFRPARQILSDRSQEYRSVAMNLLQEVLASHPADEGNFAAFDKFPVSTRWNRFLLDELIRIFLRGNIDNKMILVLMVLCPEWIPEMVPFLQRLPERSKLLLGLDAQRHLEQLCRDNGYPDNLGFSVQLDRWDGF